MEKSDETEDGACGDEKDGFVGLPSLSHSSSFGSSPSSSLDFRRQQKAPNKKKYEDDMEELNKQIRAKEAEIKSVGCHSPESVATDLRGIRSEKEAAIGKRKKLDTDLRQLNQEITKKMGLLSRTESNLHYKTEAKIDDAIRNMEWQLKTQNFRLSEERRIVAEVDKLRRSKKVLGEYFLQKKEIDKIRESQRRMRGEKEFFYKTVTNLNKREEELRKKSQEKKVRTEELKKDLDQLYEKKRVLFAEFKQAESDYQRTVNEKRHKHRKESFKRREEEKKAKEQAWRKEILQFEAHTEPFEDEKNLCNTLISYLQRYVTTDREDVALLSPREEHSDHPIGSAPGPADSLDDGMFVRLKKSEDAEADYSITNKRPSRRSRKGRKLSVTKPLAHTPQIIAQFSSLNLNAPSNMSEVTASVEQLQARKRYYEEQAVGVVPRPLLGNLSGSFSSSGSISSLESPLRERSTTWGFVEVPPAIAENQTPSDAGTSAESGFHDMSRQASKTESSESAAECMPCDQALEEMIRQSAEYGESEHSRSSSDTITPDDHIADDNDQNRATCGTSSSQCDTGNQSSDKQHKTSQGIVSIKSDSVSDNQSTAQDQLHDSESVDSSVFEEAGTKSSSMCGELLRGDNKEKVPTNDYEFGMRKKIANYDTDFPPALTRASNELKTLGISNLKHCDDKSVCDVAPNSELAVNLNTRYSVRNDCCESSEWTVHRNIDNNKEEIVPVKNETTELRGMPNSASFEFVTENESGEVGKSIEELDSVSISDKSGSHSDQASCDRKDARIGSVRIVVQSVHEGVDEVTHL